MKVDVKRRPMPFVSANIGRAFCGQSACCLLHQAVGGGGCDPAKASREEERALLAICGYPAVGEGDRLAKAQYLLEIEARGELDLAEHMQAILQSTSLTG
ncbi:hypothetical protein [Mesorhizobium sp. INR15]|uniref:hypothetical protein n=1 Tax=Mesorhizobium sp. INR15 TaxID=2654248 RepID=UPI0018968CCE|nr:hypothetical protein [Mesorhizobium sp. INR15]QPC95850.1 hypothetical protein GA829_35510 [Mesorhizobium sp. INR15]